MKQHMEDSKNGFPERFKQFMDAYKLNPNRLAIQLSGTEDEAVVKRGRVKYARWVNGEVAPAFEGLVEIAAQYGISIDWLALGTGPMLRSEPINAEVIPENNAPATTDAEKMLLRHKIELLTMENQMLKSENKRVWRMALPESAQKELDFMVSVSQTTAYSRIGFEQGYQLKVKGTDYTKKDRPMIIPQMKQAIPFRLGK